MTMAKPKKKGGPKQQLSPKAAAAKKKRDTDAANTPERKKKRAFNQKKRLEAIEEHGKNWLIGKDYDHNKQRFVSVAENRGGTQPAGQKDGAKAEKTKN